MIFDDLCAVGQMDYCQLWVQHFFGILWVNSVFKWAAISQQIFISYLKSLSPYDEIQIILGNTCMLQKPGDKKYKLAAIVHLKLWKGSSVDIGRRQVVPGVKPLQSEVNPQQRSSSKLHNTGWGVDNHNSCLRLSHSRSDSKESENKKIIIINYNVGHFKCLVVWMCNI